MPANSFFNVSGVPGNKAALSSAAIRAEIAAIAAGFDKMPTLAGNGLKAVRVNVSGTALEATAALGLTDLTLTGLLQVANGTLAAPSISRASDPNTGIYFPAADELAIAIGGVDALRFDNGGNVSTNLRLSGGASGSVTDAPLKIKNDRIVTFLDAAGGLTNCAFLWTDPSNYLNIGAGNSTRISISPAGNVGIGIAPSAAKLAVFGEYAVFHDGTYAGYFGKGSTLVTGGGASDLAVRTDAGSILFSTAGGTERMRIASGGVRIAALAGSGTRAVVVDASGNLSAP